MGFLPMFWNFSSFLRFIKNQYNDLDKVILKNPLPKFWKVIVSSYQNVIILKDLDFLNDA